MSGAFDVTKSVSTTMGKPSGERSLATDEDDKGDGDDDGDGHDNCTHP